jgi:subtilase family serine protease
MICTRKSASLALAVAAMVFSVTATSKAENKRLLGDVKIDDNVTVTLQGNTRPEINARNDRGAVSPELQMDHLQLLLKRTPEMEDALTKFIDTQYDPKSPNFHKWLSAEQLGEKFGPAQSDVEAVKSWLESQGLTVNTTYANRMFIDFSGSARQVETAFHTEIRNYEINGEMRTANARDPQIPAALTQVVHGVVSLNNFRPKAMHTSVHQAHLDAKTGEYQREYTKGGSGHGDVEKDYTNGGGYETIVPYDLAKIYDIAPLFSAGISGQGMKIVVVEDTNLWNCNATNTVGPCSSTTSDWAVFRNTFGLGKYTAGNLLEETPGPTVGTNCASPSTGRGYPASSGINSDDVEAAIDVQWASAAAPSATIINAACANPSGGFGGLTAIQNILNHPNADNVDAISMSYGESEERTGATLNAAFNTAFKAAATAGVAVFVSSGDEDAASSDNEDAAAKDGISISGWMSSPYDVSVGGLDFADTFLGEAGNYWNATNNVFYGSAKSYIPEQPWNDSCASTLLTAAEGYASPYGTAGFCNSTTAANDGFHLVVGGSGGPSACATGAAAVTGVAGGTCAGYAKPAWQSIYGMPADGVRDTPDVSLMAANGLWGHYYIICYSDSTSSGVANGSVACTGQPATWAGYGGTSVSSPIFAAIQALVVQHKGTLQGLPTPRYYALAATEYGASGNSACNSTLGNGSASSCIFHDVTLGDIDSDCQAHSGGTKYNCYLPSGTYGVLSTNNSAYAPAYSTTPGWDFATGIGSVDAYNLVMSY